jgi:hypothetical protein
MNKTIWSIATVVLSLLSVQQLPGQIRLDGEFRTRTEYRHGYTALPARTDNPSIITGQRSRLQLEYRKEWLRTYLGIQDVRIWGDEQIYGKTGVFGDHASLDLNEAWVELSFLDHYSVKIGRQYFDYDDSRLLSMRYWNNHTVKYDAFLFQIARDKYQLQAAVSYNNEGDMNAAAPYPSGKMKTLSFLRVQYNFSPALYASVLALGSGFTKTDSSETIYMRGSFGTYLNYRMNGLNTWASYYYQSGKNTKGRNVHAWNLNARADRATGRIRPGVGFSLISGNKLSDSNKDNLFDILYGVRHATYGYMDYFSNLPKSTMNGGLNDFYGLIDVQVVKNLNIIAEYHYFRLNTHVPDPNSITGANYNKGLGSEIDLWFRLRFSPIVGINGGYSLMIPRTTLEAIQSAQPGTTGHWGWLQLTVKPVFLISE